MLSRSSRQSLDTFETRKKYLTIHADHKNWTLISFISFTISAEAVQQLAISKFAKDAQTITAVSSDVRIASELFILNMNAEMRHYEISNLYQRFSEYYKDHYLCLWKVTESEIVEDWEWNDLVRNDHWYEKIVLSSFKKYNKKNFVKFSNEKTLNFSTLLNVLLDTFSVQRTRHSEQMINDFSDLNNSFCIDWDIASEEYFKNEVDWFDTNDEIEKTNAADDMIKILKKNWWWSRKWLTYIQLWLLMKNDERFHFYILDNRNSDIRLFHTVIVNKRV